MKYIDKQALQLFGITGVQIGALFYLKQHAHSTMKQMAETLNLDKSAITSLVRRLEKLSLVERMPSPDDGRAFMLRLTPLGSEKLAAVTPFLVQFNQTIEQEFSEQELDVVTRYLERMRALS